MLCPVCGNQVDVPPHGRGPCGRCGATAMEGAAVRAVWGSPPTTISRSLPVGSLVFVTSLAIAAAIGTVMPYRSSDGGVPVGAVICGFMGLVVLGILAWALPRELRATRVCNEGLLACGRIDRIREGSSENGFRFDLTIDLPGHALYQATADHSHYAGEDDVPAPQRKVNVLVPVRVDPRNLAFVLIDWRVVAARGPR